MKMVFKRLQFSFIFHVDYLRDLSYKSDPKCPVESHVRLPWIGWRWKLFLQNWLQCSKIYFLFLFFIQACASRKVALFWPLASFYTFSLCKRSNFIISYDNICDGFLNRSQTLLYCHSESKKTYSVSSTWFRSPWKYKFQQHMCEITLERKLYISIYRTTSLS